MAANNFGNAVGLACRECGTEQSWGIRYVCPECFGPLDIVYDYSDVTREQVTTSPRQDMWRYAPILPVAESYNFSRTLSPGGTKLLPADTLAQKLGMRKLWIKDDSGNPTHSFKDRVVGTALIAAEQFNCDVLACASTGNLAHAVAAAAARAGMTSAVFVPEGLEFGKTMATRVYGTNVVEVEGTYDTVNRLCSLLVSEQWTESWGFVNVNLRPYYSEGSKTVGFEIAEQLGWRLPQQVVVPVAAGSLLTKTFKAFSELSGLGWVDGLDDTPLLGLPRMFGAQGSGCAPVSEAYSRGDNHVSPVKSGEGLAKSLAIGDPADGQYALNIVNRSGGAFADVTDQEIVDGMKLLACTEGVLGETSGGVAVGVLKKLLAQGHLDPEAETVIVNTGEGLKTLDAFQGNIFRDLTIRADTEEVFKRVQRNFSR